MTRDRSARFTCLRLNDSSVSSRTIRDQRQSHDPGKSHETGAGRVHTYPSCDEESRGKGRLENGMFRVWPRKAGGDRCTAGGTAARPRSIPDPSVTGAGHMDVDWPAGSGSSKDRTNRPGTSLLAGRLRLDFPRIPNYETEPHRDKSRL